MATCTTSMSQTEFDMEMRKMEMERDNKLRRAAYDRMRDSAPYPFFRDTRVATKRMEIIDGNVYELSYNMYGELLNKAFCCSSVLDTILGVSTPDTNRGVKCKNKLLLLV